MENPIYKSPKGHDIEISAGEEWKKTMTPGIRIKVSEATDIKNMENIISYCKDVLGKTKEGSIRHTLAKCKMDACIYRINELAKEV